MRHLLDLFDVTREEIEALLAQTSALKDANARGQRRPTLAGKVLGLVFEKPSLRTRVSFQAAMAQMSGASLFLNAGDAGLGTRESIGDFAKTLSQYVDGVVLRTFSHSTVELFASLATCPVINGLSDSSHPCQALADLFTVREKLGDLKGRHMVFVGDGNNVARSLAVCCGHLGVRFTLAAPKHYEFKEPFLQKYRLHFAADGLAHSTDPLKAVGDADVIYTDVWTSMGQEAEREARRRDFAAFQINRSLVAAAPPHAVVMHCLPAHREEEITSEVLDSPRSIVFQQAGNRLHLQKALLQWLLSGDLPTAGRSRRRLGVPRVTRPRRSPRKD
jgi:ornithine carbamoyltransferase